MTRRPVRAVTQTRSRKRERIARAVARRPTMFASSITQLGMQLFTLVRLGYEADAPLFPAHLKSSSNAMGTFAARLPVQPL